MASQDVTRSFDAGHNDIKRLLRPHDDVDDGERAFGTEALKTLKNVLGIKPKYPVPDAKQLEMMVHHNDIAHPFFKVWLENNLSIGAVHKLVDTDNRVDTDKIVENYVRFKVIRGNRKITSTKIAREREK
ncbi:hypothetical protein JM18_004319 [Phytophthora kernoviae]|uniref:RxLR effector protein n=2 Tax=Phytophthora kernoviae TaxID=325452 RepID=A0A8T0LRS7_9STRA|nr:hypothetical protein G195_005994 [Phytophthora kernoviae 00238/432]KAG2519899.1 hypothetical protein JM16_005199 [Phytophthora kernoviae]KAG2526164.1 hypothetical protein JM18_004319 [Phytophthora kernoviae]